MKKNTVLIIVGILVVLIAGMIVLKFVVNDAWSEEGEGNVFQGILIDGMVIEGLGQFRDSTVENGLKSYESNKFGIFFNYPTNYRLFENQHEESQTEHYTVVIAPEPYISEAIASAMATEWPASMHFSFYRKPNQDMSLEDWIRTDQRSNFNADDFAQDGVLAPTTVADIPAFTYRASGLHDYTYVAFMHEEWMIVAAAAYMDEDTDQDFQTILSSMRFK